MDVHLRILLILAGLTGIYSATFSKVSVRAGGSITIPCLYDSQYRDHVKYLCQGQVWGSCSYVVRTNQPHSSERFSISDDKDQRIFNVTIKNLTRADTHYWCIVEINHGTDVGEYFRLSVTRGTPSLYVDHQEVTGFEGEKITISCRYSNSGVKKWCRLGGSCVMGRRGSIDETRVTLSRRSTSVFTVTMRRLTTESSGWYWCAVGDLQMPVHVTVIEKPITTTLPPDHNTVTEPGAEDSASVDLKNLLIPLALLIFIVMVTLFIWFLLKMHKQSNAESSPIIKAEEEVTYCNVEHERKTSHQAVEEAEYCNVGYKRKTSGHRSYAESDVDVMYSSVVTLKKQKVKRDEAQDNDVVYSVLAQSHQNI